MSVLAIVGVLVLAATLTALVAGLTVAADHWAAIVLLIAALIGAIATFGIGVQLIINGLAGLAGAVA